MGHEYVELKNTAAAVDAYRHAVDINPKDYRAWYGLGQTYEILTMYFYALFYYRKATALRPYDARMWCAMAGCYKLLNRKVQSNQIEGIVSDVLEMVGIVAEVGGFLDLGDKHVMISVPDVNLVAVDDKTYAYVTRLNEVHPRRPLKRDRHEEDRRA